MKNLKISKELISDVLNIPNKNIADIYMDGNYLLIKKDNNRIEEYNIYEFAFKCKEWANKNSYYVASGKYYQNWDCEIFKISWDAKSWHEPEETFDAPTEPEAIFKACEWILSEVNK